MNSQLLNVKNEVKKAIKGKDDIIEYVMMAILAGGHILFEDEPGLGKTTMVKAFGNALGVTNTRIQFTPDTTASDIIGFAMFNEKTRDYEFQSGPIVTNLLLADEINRTSPKTQAALLQAMEENSISVENEIRQLPEPFIVMATQNPISNAGTQRLPEAQMDRFMLRLSMGRPDVDSQMEILKSLATEKQDKNVNQVLTVEEVVDLQKKSMKVTVDDRISRYMIDLCEQTVKEEDIKLPVGPRGLIATAKMAKAHAFLYDREYVNIDDVQAVFPITCAHRLILSPKAEQRGVKAVDLLEDVVKKVKAPSVL